MAASAKAVEVIPAGDLGKPALWEPIEGTPAVESVVVDGKPALKITCPFSTMEGWRAGADYRFPENADLGGSRWLKVKAKADDPEAVSEIVLYFQSGAGWYRGGIGGLKKEWSTLTGTRGRFGTEGVPDGWGRVKQMRVGIMPAAKRDTVVYISGFEGTSALGTEDAAKVGHCTTLAELKTCLAGTPQEGEFARGEILLNQAEKSGDIEKPEAQKLIKEARKVFVDAYLRIQKPREGEVRSAWCHSGTGPEMGWTKAVDLLADNGFNTIFPNLLWSGVAYYPSKVVPVSPAVAQKGDQLKELLEAGKRRGVAVHVWKVCWQFGWQGDPSYVVPFRFAGRTQVDRDGKHSDWLCPVNVANRKYELDAIKELVRNYDIAGFQLDYIRYSGEEWCFCPACKAAFEKKIGKKLKDWPVPVTGEGKYAGKYDDFRREAITSFVREVRKETKKIRPSMKLSADVFPVADSARNSVFQDWGLWVREGLVDFVCPMNYTENLAEMRSRTAADRDTIAGKAPFYEGLYATYSPDQVQEPDMLAAQIAAARELGAGGFVLFEIQDHVLTGLLPALRLGITKP